MSDPDGIVAAWSDRAAAYARLVERWPLFTRLADRLVDELPDDFAGCVLDLGAGAGLLSARVLERHPRATVEIAEPARPMRELAVARLGAALVRCGATRAEELPVAGELVDAVLSSAAFHLIDERQALPRIAARLRPGGLLAFNLWWHAWDATAELDVAPDWDAALRSARRDAGFEDRARPPGTGSRRRSEPAMAAAAAAAGLSLEAITRDDDDVGEGFFLEFAAMSSTFLDDVPAEVRPVICAAALARLTGEVRVPTVRLRFRRT